MPASLRQKELLGKFRLTSTLVAETGLHIGGGGENLDIGGLDKPVIRDPVTLHPYIPGSSIKGKLRAILERLTNKPLNRHGGSGIYRYESDDLADGFTEVKQGNDRPPLLIFFEGASHCPVSRLFGSTGSDCWVKTEVANRDNLDRVSDRTRYIRQGGDNSRSGEFVDSGESYTKIKGRNAPARLFVRDCHLQEESADRLKKIDTGLYMTEWKFENSIDRVTAAANPRQFERVPKGAKFDFELVYSVENVEQAREDLQNLLQCIMVLEDDALGGHGSRGYGKVRFQSMQFLYQNYEGLFTGDGSLQLSKPNQLDNPVIDTTTLPDRFTEIQGLLTA